MVSIDNSEDIVELVADHIVHNLFNIFSFGHLALFMSC